MRLTLPKGQLNYYRIIYALAISSAVTAVLVIIEAITAHSTYYLFLLTNLLLAYIPPIIACYIVYRLRKTHWIGIWNILLFLLWLAFLPNSFYLITDLIHAQDFIGIDLLYNIVIIMFCIFNGLVAGYLSIYLIHRELLKKLYYKHAHLIITSVLLLCSFAIYLGRYLRWSSWDVAINPAGFLFDITDSVSSPSTHPEVFTTTLTFFALLGCMYLVIWQILQVVRKTE